MPFRKFDLWAKRHYRDNTYFVQPGEGESCKRLPLSSNVQMNAKILQLLMGAITDAMLILRIFKEVSKRSTLSKAKIGLN